MEDTLQDIESQSLQKTNIQDLLKQVIEAAGEAADIRDERLAQNSELRRALDSVEHFLRKSHRICYGGMAINAHLPPEKKFYNFSKSLPDYDFFSPHPETDAKALVELLKQKNFKDVSIRLGMHAGTYKVFASYHGVADITFMPEWLYKKLLKWSIVDDGIHYADADFLRMNMYLELSRPQGEVERWDKVYKRLLLLNMTNTQTSKSCLKKQKNPLEGVDFALHTKLIHYCVENKCVYAGPDLIKVYKTPKSIKAGYLVHSKAPAVLFLENPEFHIPILRQLFHEHTPHGTIKITYWQSQGEFPELYGIRLNEKIVCLLAKEQSCNSYNTVKIPPRKELRIVSLDTLIVFYYMISLIHGLEGFLAQDLFCFARELVEVSRSTRDKGRSGAFPPFSIQCQGHQPSKESLLKEKAGRVRKYKKKTEKNRKVSNSTTRKHR